MSLLGRALARSLPRNAWTSAAALVGVALGVASVVAVHLLCVTVARSLEGPARPQTGSANAVASRAGAAVEDYFELRRAWRRGELPGVSAMWPVVEGRIVVRGREYRIVGSDWFAAPPSVQDGPPPVEDGPPPVEDGPPPVQDGPPPVEGALAAGGERVLVASTESGLEPGDSIALRGATYEVVGRIEAGTEALLYVDLADAFELLGSERLTHVLMARETRFDGLAHLLDAFMPGIAAGLPEHEEVLLGWEIRSLAALRPEYTFGRAVLFNLGALGLLSLAVAWFLIFQTAVVWLRRQQTLFDRLRALGVEDALLARLFLAGLACLGAIATVAGTALGWWLAAYLARTASIGFEAPEALTLDLPVAIKAVLSGTLVAVAGGVIAWRRSAPGTEGRRVWPWVALAGAGVSALGVLMEDTGLAGAFAAILGLACAGAWAVAPLLRAARTRIEHVRGPLFVRLGLRETLWYAGDLEIAVAALVLAVAAGIGIGLMVESFRDDFARVLEQRLAHDVFVDLAGTDAGPAAAALAQAIPGALIQVYGRALVNVDGRPVEIGYTRFDAAEAGRYGLDRALAPFEAIANERFVRELDVGSGSPVALATGSVNIVHAHAGYGDVRPRLLVDDGTARLLLGELVHDRFSVAGADGGQVEAVVRAFVPNATIERRSQVRETALAVFDRTFAITGALTLLALFVAFAGMYNALAAMRLGQRASRVRLDALGVSPRERLAVDATRAVVVATVVLAIAVPVGIGIGWLLCHVVNPRAFGWTVQLGLPPSALWPPIVAGIGAATAASLLPAPRERGADD